MSSTDIFPYSDLDALLGCAFHVAIALTSKLLLVRLVLETGGTTLGTPKVHKCNGSAGRETGWRGP